LISYLHKIVIIFLFFITPIYALTLQKANIYIDQNITQWTVSEKLDGIRAYWDGKNLLSREGKVINAPKYFTQKLPPFELDGELWSKRGDFENIQSIVMDKTPSGKWSEISYMVFEVPHASGDFEKRLKKAQKYIEDAKLLHVKIIEQKVLKSPEELNLFLEDIIKNGGEGAMLKDGSKGYFDGRSDSLLKVKKAQDMEARVIGYKEGNNKYKGVMGSLHVRLKDGVEFFIGSGFSDEIRKNPPKIGEIVTFKYYGFTKGGKPKFTSFMRVRRD
jgi:DNA ligase-1